MSMTREQMLHFMENPDQLNEKTLVELKEILEEYPYFQSAHLLYIRNLSNEKSFRFASQLKITAVHTPDRAVLYRLLNPTGKSKENQEFNTAVPASKKVFSSEEERTRKAENQIAEVIYRLEGDIDAGKTLAQLVKDINEAASKHKSGFLQKFMLSAEAQKENSGKNEEVSANETSENDEFITETLARIYIKQGLYHKAIDAFQRLKLKYPEKSIYFARQIDEVTNLLNK